MFADDTSLILNIDRDLYRDTLKEELKRVMKWFENNSLLLNYDKTDYLFCGPNFRLNLSKGEYDLLGTHHLGTHHLGI